MVSCPSTSAAASATYVPAGSLGTCLPLLPLLLLQKNPLLLILTDLEISRCVRQADGGKRKSVQITLWIAINDEFSLVGKITWCHSTPHCNTVLTVCTLTVKPNHSPILVHPMQPYLKFAPAPCFPVIQNTSSSSLSYYVIFRQHHENWSKSSITSIFYASCSSKKINNE